MSNTITINVKTKGKGKGKGILNIENAYVALLKNGNEFYRLEKTNNNGKVDFKGVDDGTYQAWFLHYPVNGSKPYSTSDITVGSSARNQSSDLEPIGNIPITIEYLGRYGSKLSDPVDGGVTIIRSEIDNESGFNGKARLILPRGVFGDESSVIPSTLEVPSDRFESNYTVAVSIPLLDSNFFRENKIEFPDNPGEATITTKSAVKKGVTPPSRPPVMLSRTGTSSTPDIRLWEAIRTSSESLQYTAYSDFIDELVSTGPSGETSERFTDLKQRRYLPFTDSDTYRVLKAATEAFVMVNCGVVQDMLGRPTAESIDYLGRRDLPANFSGNYLKTIKSIKSPGVDVKVLPYLAIIQKKLGDLPFLRRNTKLDTAQIDLVDGLMIEKLSNPCLLELIWSYWHEEGMQVQTMNAISRRFQNMRSNGPNDPLANMEINPLRPLNNLIWSYIQDEQHRLTVVRRNYEYDHHYGLRLEGRAVQDFRPADTRSKFIEAFHELLRLCGDFYKQDDDTTVKADAFGVLNALKEVHLILSQGAHCQFGDMPATARVEMLMQQWLLARPEFREFLPTRVMVAYPEPWMDRVDAMKKLQGWTDTSVMHFHNLAVFGEQILLSIRYGNWSSVFEPTQAFNFARHWRPQIQGYIHAYRAATGVELGAPTIAARVDATLPSVLLQQRLQAQQRGAMAR